MSMETTSTDQTKTDKWTNGQTDNRTNGQTDKRTNGQTEKWKNRQTVINWYKASGFTGSLTMVTSFTCVFVH